jgi:RNA exonuclease 4
MVLSSNWKALRKEGLDKVKVEKRSVTSASSNISSISDEISSNNKNVDSDIWFDDVDEVTLKRSAIEAMMADSSDGNSLKILDLFPPTKSASKIDNCGKYIAMDCEMVGVGRDGKQNALARVSIVNYNGHVIYDKFCRPNEKVTDYRSDVSGVSAEDLKNSPNIQTIQHEVWDLIQGKILIGHGLVNDFRVLFLEHPRKMIRDTTNYKPFRKSASEKTPSLRELAKEFLGIEIQREAHDSADDARVAMLLYRTHRRDWENAVFRGDDRKEGVRTEGRVYTRRAKGDTIE